MNAREVAPDLPFTRDKCLVFSHTRSPTVAQTITFEQIHQRVARHVVAETARNAPKAAARRAVYQLASALADLSADERLDVLALLAEETAELAPVVA
jgi:hypothetical protein